MNDILHAPASGSFPAFDLPFYLVACTQVQPIFILHEIL